MVIWLGSHKIRPKTAIFGQKLSIGMWFLKSSNSWTSYSIRMKLANLIHFSVIYRGPYLLSRDEPWRLARRPLEISIAVGPERTPPPCRNSALLPVRIPASPLDPTSPLASPSSSSLPCGSPRLALSNDPLLSSLYAQSNATSYPWPPQLCLSPHSSQALSGFLQDLDKKSSKSAVNISNEKLLTAFHRLWLRSNTRTHTKV